MFGMNTTQLQAFVERISATAIANQAILKCKLLGVPMTVENVIFFVGDFFDPSDPEFAGMIDQIHAAIVYVVERPGHVPRLDDDNVIRLPC